MAYNLVNNSFPRACVDSRIRELTFHLTERRLSELWNRVPETASPSRRLCDLFWMTLPWDALSAEMGGISALEMGCGTGVYGRLLEEILGASFDGYVGVDIEASDQWRQFDGPKFRFEVARASEVGKFLLGSNLLLTQSALEHFEEDLLYFRQVSDYVSSSGSPIVQIHLIPCASCITTYPWHGIRVYTPRTVSRITRLFGPETKAYLLSLGSSGCNRIHRKYITWPNLRRGWDLRQAKMEEYRQGVRSAISRDFGAKSNSSAFYALVLASNFETDVSPVIERICRESIDRRTSCAD